MRENAVKSPGGGRRILAQLLAGSAKNLLMFDIGSLLAFKTIIIANILNAPTEPSFTPDEASWFASLQFMSQPVGCLLSALVLERLGRKRSMMLLNIPLFIGWMTTALAQSVPVLYAASIITGLGMGFIEAPAMTYIGEITEPNVRGIMTSLAEAMIGGSILIVYLLGVFLDWRTIAYICTAIPVFSIVAISQVPESPMWLLAQNRTEEAEKSLCWLRGWVQPESVQEEFSKLVSYKNKKILRKPLTQEQMNRTCMNDEAKQNTVEARDENKNGNNSGQFICFEEYEKQINVEKIKNNLNCESDTRVETSEEEKYTLSAIVTDLTEPTMLRALLFMFGFNFFHSACGYTAVRSFAVPVFKQLGVSVEPYRANVLSAVVVFLGNFILTVLVKFTGKRKLVLVSIFGAALTCISLGVYAFQTSGSVATTSLVPFVIYTAHVFFVGFGLGPVPWLYISEVFPYRGRGMATGITASSIYLFSGLVTKTFYTLTDYLTLGGSFVFYGVVSLIGFFYLYLLMPETEGRTLQDIEEHGVKKA